MFELIKTAPVALKWLCDSHVYQVNIIQENQPAIMFAIVTSAIF